MARGQVLSAPVEKQGVAVIDIPPGSQFKGIN